MSVLTKVFIVLVNIMSVALVALVIAFVANTENYKKLVDDERTAKKAATLSADVAQRDKQDALQKLSKSQTDLSELANAKTLEVKAAQEQLAQAQADLVAARREQAKLEAQVTGLGAAMSQNQSILDAALKELGERREAAVKLEHRVIQLTDRNNELANTVEAYGRQVRRVNEQLTQITEEKGKLDEMWRKVPANIRDGLIGALEGKLAETIQTPVPVQGEITKISKAGDQVLAQINLGKADRVVPNTKFMIFRDNKFLGNLIVVNVADRESVGRVELAQGDLNAGDKVMSGMY